MTASATHLDDRTADRKPRADSFLPIPVATLVPQQTAGVTLYMKDTAGLFHLYRSSDIPVLQEDIDRLAERGIRNLYVEFDDHARYQMFLRDALEDVIRSPSIAPLNKVAQLGEVVRSVLEEAFRAGDLDHSVEATRKAAEHTVSLLSSGELTARDLSRVLYHDYHTFTHSTNVSLYALLLARRLGWKDEGTLREIGQGALLHDLGKLEISVRILTKPGRLTDAEFDVIKQHPTTGFRRLAPREDLTFGQLMMVYQHHERLDGQGYPVGCCGDEIHPWARLCAVADVFEALTSHRPYRAPMAPVDAMKILEKQSGKGLEAEMVWCWQSILSNS